MRDGALRFGSVIQGLVNGDLPVEIGDPDGGHLRLLRSKAMNLSGLTLAMPAMMIILGEPPLLGLNLFTAELIIMVSSGLFLLNALRRLI